MHFEKGTQKKKLRAGRAGKQELRLQRRLWLWDSKIGKIPGKTRKWDPGKRTSSQYSRAAVTKATTPLNLISNSHPSHALSRTLKFFWDSGVGLSRSMSFFRSSSMVDLEVGLGDARRSLVEALSLVWAISLPSL